MMIMMMETRVETAAPRRNEKREARIFLLERALLAVAGCCGGPMHTPPLTHSRLSLFLFVSGRTNLPKNKLPSSRRPLVSLTRTEMVRD